MKTKQVIIYKCLCEDCCPMLDNNYRPRGFLAGRRGYGSPIAIRKTAFFTCALQAKKFVQVLCNGYAPMMRIWEYGRSGEMVHALSRKEIESLT